jgi:hypothetical protein
MSQLLRAECFPGGESPLSASGNRETEAFSKFPAPAVQDCPTDVMTFRFASHYARLYQLAVSIQTCIRQVKALKHNVRGSGCTDLRSLELGTSWR